jgi:hypothetical protein
MTAPFNPRSLNPAAWFDGSDRQTLFTASSGGSIVGDNLSIARWEDKSGNNRHISQSDTIRQPIIVPNFQNGYSSVFFDGSNDHMNNLILTLPTGTLTWVGVFRPQLKGVYHNIFDSNSMLWLRPNNSLELNTGGGAVSPLAYVNTWIIVTVRASSTSSPGSRIRVNGSQVAQNNSFIGPTTGVQSISLFHRGGSQTYLGHFGEMLWFTGDLNNSQISSAERYLSQKWNVRLT